MKITSKQFAHNDVLPLSCVARDLGGEEQAPEISWQGVPKEAKSLALTCFDPDAPTGSGFWHWIVANIPATETGTLNIDSLPAGAEIVANDAGQTAWAAPCPPEGHGEHRYQFTLHALGIDTIDVQQLPQAYTRFFINMNEIARAELTGRFTNEAAVA